MVLINYHTVLHYGKTEAEGALKDFPAEKLL